MTRLRRIANGLERDRYEPDKVLCYVADLRRIAIEEELEIEAHLNPTSRYVPVGIAPGNTR